MDTVALRPRGVGEILDGALRLYKEDFGLYVLTALGVFLPLAILMAFLVMSSSAGEPGGAALAIVFVTFLVMPFAMIVLWTALLFQMNDRLQDREPALGSSVGAAARRLFRVMWAGIIATLTAFLVMMSILLTVGMATGIASVAMGETGSLIVAGVAFAALALTVGLRTYAGTMLYLPAIVTEDHTGFGSVKRSFALTGKGWVRVSAVLFVAWLLIFVPSLAVSFLTGTTSTMFDPNAAASGTVSTMQLAVQQFLVVVANGLWTPFFSACMLLTYYDQRVRLEAFDLEAEVGALVD